MEKLEENLDYYIKKDPSDDKAVLRAVLARNKTKFFLSTAGKLVQSLMDLYTITLVQEFMKFIELENYTEDQWWSAAYTGALLVFIKIF